MPAASRCSVTSRDWTQAEAIKLLDDVAYYSIEPIKALLPKNATLPVPVAGVVMDAGTVRVKFHLGNVCGTETGEVKVEVAARP